MQAFSIAAAGMMEQTRRVNTIAGNLANALTPGYKAQPPGGQSPPPQSAPAPSGAAGIMALMQDDAAANTVDPASELTSLIMAQRTYELNAKVLTTADEMTKTLMQTV